MRLNTKFIRIRMIEKDIDSANELARLVNVSRSSISMILRGHQQPSVETIGKLCRVLDCTPNDLFLIEELTK